MALKIDLIQELKVNKTNKILYGELHSPFSLIEEMVFILPEHLFSNPNLRWLDPGCGRGYYSIYIYHKLLKGLSEVILDIEERKKYILSKMLYLVELNPEHHEELANYFPYPINLKSEDFLDSDYPFNFDIIIGNPPFNFGGIKKVPTNQEKKKKSDGITIWHEFIKKSISLLKDSGLLLFITPSIWMKTDKAKIYDYMTYFKIHKICSFSNTEMNQIFKGEAQTPSCYFLLEKKPTDGVLKLFDREKKQWVDFFLNSEKIIPVFGVSTINKLLPFTRKYGCLDMKKTNLPSKKISFSKIKNKKFKYENIKTCYQKKFQPELIINYSDLPCCFHGERKIVMAHGVYGLPIIDEQGKYGISNRDKFVITGYEINDLIRIKSFLSLDFSRNLFKATRYRMMFLERYIFRLIPDITKIPNFPQAITEESVKSFFKLCE